MTWQPGPYEALIWRPYDTTAHEIVTFLIKAVGEDRFLSTFHAARLTTSVASRRAYVWNVAPGSRLQKYSGSVLMPAAWNSLLPMVLELTGRCKNGPSGTLCGDAVPQGSRSSIPTCGDGSQVDHRLRRLHCCFFFCVFLPGKPAAAVRRSRAASSFVFFCLCYSTVPPWALSICPLPCSLLPTTATWFFRVLYNRGFFFCQCMPSGSLSSDSIPFRVE